MRLVLIVDVLCGTAFMNWNNFNTGNITLKNDILIIWAKCKIITLGITDSIFRGMLEVPEDLFSKECMKSSISSIDTWANTKFIWLQFFNNLGDILGTFGIKFSVLTITLAKKLLKLVAVSLSLSMILSWVVLLEVFFKLTIFSMPSQVFYCVINMSSKVINIVLLFWFF